MSSTTTSNLTANSLTIVQRRYIRKVFFVYLPPPPPHSSLTKRMKTANLSKLLTACSIALLVMSQEVTSRLEAQNTKSSRSSMLTS